MTPTPVPRPPPRLDRPVRVLVIDDSALVRTILGEGLSHDPEIKVVGVAADAFEAGDLIPRLQPDVLTLDVEMPRMNGIEFLRRLMPQYPLPVIMVSALTNQGGRLTLDALALGAVDFITKPRGDQLESLQSILDELAAKIKAAAAANLPRARRAALSTRTPPTPPAPSFPPGEPSRKLVALGASTGGSEALKLVLRWFPRETPGILVVQHMPPGFTKLFAERLDAHCTLTVREAADGDQVRDGLVLIAPGGQQMRCVKESGGGWRVRVKAEPGTAGHQPSVDVLFASVAEAAGSRAVGVVMTGMGADGAASLRRMRDAGARCFAQDQATSVVFGMPNEAFRRGGAEALVPLADIAPAISEALKTIKN